MNRNCASLPYLYFYLPVFHVEISSLPCQISLSIHIYPHKELHEGTFAIDINLWTANDLNELIFTENSATDRFHDTLQFSISTSSQKISDHQKILQLKAMIILEK